MAVAALVVAILALLAAGASALYAKQVADVEKGRRHDERRPRLDLEVDEARWLRITVVSNEAIDEVYFELVPEGTLIAGAAAIVGLGNPWAASGSLGSFDVGAPRRVQVVEREEGHGGRSGLRLTCRKGGDEWVVTGRFELPPVSRDVT